MTFLGGLVGGLAGALIGAISAALIGFIAGWEFYRSVRGTEYEIARSFPFKLAFTCLFLGGIMGALGGTFVGGIAGLVAGFNRPTFRFRLCILGAILCLAVGAFNGFMGSAAHEIFHDDLGWSDLNHPYLLLAMGTGIGTVAGLLGGWLLGRILGNLRWGRADKPLLEPAGSPTPSPDNASTTV